MAFMLKDFQCKDCNNITEVLIDKRDEFKEDQPKPECSHCKSTNLEPILSAGAGNSSHGSWARWRTPV